VLIDTTLFFGVPARKTSYKAQSAQLIGSGQGSVRETLGRRRRELGLKVEEMISWRLIVPAVLVAAAIAGCLTYFVTPSPPVEAVQRIPPTFPNIGGPDAGTRTNIDQHPTAEESAEAFLQAAKAILRKTPDAQASAGANEPPTAEHIPLPKRRPLPRP
jgi:hypothetical protein